MQKYLQDDQVKLSLFKTESTEIDAELEKSVQKITEIFAKDYLFNLESPRFFKKKTPSGREYLKAVVSVGDNITDEWFVAFVAFNLTKSLPLTATLTDSEGQFLLIEAAEQLPRWISPENSENRVFVVNGEVQIVSEERFIEYREKAKPKPDRLVLESALKCVWEVPEHKIDNSEKMTKCILNKLDQFGNFKVLTQGTYSHSTVLLLPKKIIFLLRKFPHLISAAAKSFCLRGSDENSRLRVQRSISLAEGDLAYEAIKMNRFIYAQLESTRNFNCPRLEAVGYCTTNGEEKESKIEKEMGSKILLGIEIIASRAKEWLKSEKLKINYEIFRQEFIEEWQDFNIVHEKLNTSEDQRKKLFCLDFLASNSAFRNNFCLHHKILTRKNLTTSTGKENEFSSQNVPTSVFQWKLIKSVMKLSQNQNYHTQRKNAGKSDPTDWMNVQPIELDSYFMRDVDFGEEKTSENYQRVEFDENNPIGEMVSNVSDFVGRMSDHSGVEFPTDTNLFGKTSTELFDAKNFSVARSREKKFMDFEYDSDLSFESNYESSLDSEVFRLNSGKFLQAIHGEIGLDSNGIADGSSGGGKMNDGKNSLGNTEILDQFSAVSQAMEAELRDTSLPHSFDRVENSEENQEMPLTDLEVDANLAKNLLSSFEGQAGGPGATSNLLSGLDKNKKK